jgi:hypothetical protein
MVPDGGEEHERPGGTVMRILHAAALVIGFGLVAASELAAKDVDIRVPFVRVHVGRGYGPGVFVGTPGPAVVVGRPAPGVPVIVDGPAPPPEGVLLHPPRPAEGSVVLQAMTHRDFARVFQPAAGTYEVLLIHPDTCCPVKVCFTLPCGCPKKVRVERHELEFDYGKTEVEIRFRRDGTVKVEYRD